MTEVHSHRLRGRTPPPKPFQQDICYESSAQLFQNSVSVKGTVALLRPWVHSHVCANDRGASIPLIRRRTPPPEPLPAGYTAGSQQHTCEAWLLAARIRMLSAIIPAVLGSF
ncbi:hypothetical protein BaRGS_00030779 [Batillaria attramentaria]|uniref:Uncharacterized protein n=1 Tax=Batillaria attramentaria TaxID=370345 RepID=A0ABD0JS87_9CAEN